MNITKYITHGLLSLSLATILTTAKADPYPITFKGVPDYLNCLSPVEIDVLEQYLRQALHYADEDVRLHSTSGSHRAYSIMSQRALSESLSIVKHLQGNVAIWKAQRPGKYLTYAMASKVFRNMMRIFESHKPLLNPSEKTGHIELAGWGSIISAIYNKNLIPAESFVYTVKAMRQALRIYEQAGTCYLTPYVAPKTSP